MPDKQVTVGVPEERVPEFYSWFALFLASPPGGPLPVPGADRGPGRGPGRHRRHGPPHAEPRPWSPADTEEAAWLYGRLAPPARRLFDLLATAPGQRIAGEDLAVRIGLDKGAHGVAGVLAWPGRYCRRLGRDMPIATESRADGGTDYFMEPAVAALFTAPAAPPR